GEHDVVVARAVLDPGVEVLAGGEVDPGRRATVGLVGVPVDVRAVGDHDPVRVTRVDATDRVVARAEDGVGRRALLHHARAPGVLAVLVGGAVRQLVV